MADALSPWKTWLSMSPGTLEVNRTFLPGRKRSLSATVLQQFSAQPQKHALHKFRTSSLAILASVNHTNPTVSRKTDTERKNEQRPSVYSKQLEVLLGQIKSLLYIHNLLKVKQMKEECESQRTLTVRLKEYGDVLENLQEKVVSIHERLSAQDEILRDSQKSLCLQDDFQREARQILETHTKIMIQQQNRIEHLTSQLNHSCILEVGCLMATIHLLHQPITALLVDGLVHVLRYWFPHCQHRRKLEQISKLLVLIQFYVFLRCSSQTSISSRIYNGFHHLVSCIWRKRPTEVSAGQDMTKCDDVQMSALARDTHINETNIRISNKCIVKNERLLPKSKLCGNENRETEICGISAPSKTIKLHLKSDRKDHCETRPSSKTHQNQDGIRSQHKTGRNKTVSHQTSSNSEFEKSVDSGRESSTLVVPESKKKSSKSGVKKHVTFVDP